MANQSDRKRILIIDDDKSMTHFLRLGLERTGHFEVCEEHSGLEAINTIRIFKPHLILLDIMMPDAEGTFVAAQLKEDHDLKDIPVVFLTGMVTEQELEENHGMIKGHKFVAKTDNLPKLVKEVEKSFHLAG